MPTPKQPNGADHQEASEQVKRAIIQAAWTHYAAPEFDEIDMEPRRTKLIALLTETILPFLAPPVAAPTQKAIAEAARDIRTMDWPSMSRYAGMADCNAATEAMIAAILSRHFPAPATATEQEDTASELLEGARDSLRIYEEMDPVGGDGDACAVNVAVARIRAIDAYLAARQSATQQKEQKK